MTVVLPMVATALALDVPPVVIDGAQRLALEGLSATVTQGDAEALPFGDASFDVVVSTFGVMFTPNQDKAAAELVRVQQERLAGRHARLAELVADRLRRGREGLASPAGRLVPELITDRVRQGQARLERERTALGHGIAVTIERVRRLLQTSAAQLEALSHRRVLERGYAIVRGRQTGHVIPRLAALGGETELEIVFADGELAVRRAGRTRSRATAADQGSLL